MKIPLYNKGLGGQGVTTGGSLGPRASYGDFTGVGQATAQLAETAGDIGYKFAIAEKKIETARMSNEEELKFINAADEYNVNSTEIDTFQYERNFTKNIVTPAMNRVERLNVSNGQKREIKANLLKSYQIKLTKGKKFTWDRGQAVRSNASNSLIDFKLKSVSGLNENDPEFIQGVDSALKLIEDGTLQGLSIKTDREKFLQDVELGTISSKRTNATTVEDIDDLEARIKKNTKITEPQKETELNKLNTKKTKIIDNAVAFLIESPTKEIPEDGEDEEIYVSEAELFENIDSALKGDWSFNLGAQAMWNKMSTKDQGRVRAGLVAARTNQQTQIKWKDNRKETNEDNKNDKIYTDTVEKIKNKNISITEINKLPFEGIKGEVLRQSLVTKESNRLSGKVLTDSKPLAYSETQEKMFTDDLTSVTQKFILKSDLEGAKPKNILERVGIDFSSEDANKFESYLRNKKNAAVSSEAKELVQAEKFFQDFLKGNADLVKGSKAFARLDPKSDQDFFDFQMQMRGRFSAGLAKGIDAKELLNPRNKNYILKPDDLYGKTSEQSIQNIVDFYKKTPEPTLEELKPPQKPETMSVDDWIKSDTWQNYITSSKWKKYKALQGEPN